MAASDAHSVIDAVWRIESARLIAGLARIVRDFGVAGTEQRISANLERLVSAIQRTVDPDVSFQECTMQSPSCSLFCSPAMP
jgi:predicted RNA polymerase sigma factor